MPIGVPFKDSSGIVGRNQAAKAPEGETNVSVKSNSRSLKQIQMVINCEYRDSKIILNLDRVMGDKVRLKIKDARRFAEWILMVSDRTSKKKLAREK